MLPKIVGSKFMVTLPLETSAGAVSEILNCAYPPGGAVSLETCSAMLGLAARRTLDSSAKSKTGRCIYLPTSLTGLAALPLWGRQFWRQPPFRGGLAASQPAPAEKPTCRHNWRPHRAVIFGELLHSSAGLRRNP